MSTVPYNVTEQVLRLVFSNTEPYPPQKTMWAKRGEDDTFHFYVYNDGEWHDVSGSITIPEISVYLSSFINDAGFLTEDALDGKQDLLVSGENIKTVNNISMLGSGNIDVGTYTKPSGGIPASDLSQAVQTSLGKAETALQEESVFVAEYGVTTLDQIQSALANGKVPVLYYDGYMYLYSTSTSASGDAYFINTFNPPTIRIARIDSSGWRGVNSIRVETTPNKTNDISANKTSTNKYPSTKGVADYVDAIVGDINTILDNINGEVI